MKIYLLLLILAAMSGHCPRTMANATTNFVSQETIRETLSNVGKDMNCNRNKREHPIIDAFQDPLIIVSTLDGDLVALHKYKGTVKWKMKGKPIIQTTVLKTPFSLPDPTDGSVYVFGPRSKDGAMDLMKKLSLNIPELVARSPTRSSVDNSVCIGAKSAEWYVIDPDTGQKLEEMTHEKTVTYCPVIGQRRGLYIGRTEYKLVVMDTDTKEVKWNITYNDYNNFAIEEAKEYDLKHLTSSQDGLLVTLKAKTNEVLWTAELGSTVVAAYQLSWLDLSLRRVPIFRFGGETLSHMLDQIGKSERDIFRSGSLFRSTLYVGTAHSGLYALPSITHDTVHVRSSDRRVSLLASDHSSVGWSQSSLIGHYKPLYGAVDHSPRISIDHRITDKSNPQSRRLPDFNNGDITTTDPRQRQFNGLFWYSTWAEIHLAYVVIGLVIFVVLMWVIVNKIRKNSLKYLRRLVDEALVAEKNLQLQDRYSDSSWSRHSGSTTNTNGSLKPWSSDGPTAFADSMDVHEGWYRVGKIQYDPTATLGHGCEGTIVYRGEYDKRRVAVKRILPDCLTIADREVALLRESDEHPNVLRYYCTEQDSQFRYIALDYCDATLKDYAEHPNPEKYFNLAAREALYQASSGIGHLHQLEIVHRDVKPANVLLRKTSDANYQVVISDFGLCKKLMPGRCSFSRQSGLRGTEGWIAPEMMREDGGRMTYSVDVFSLGCVFYYVLSRGEHPFGKPYARQANILNHKFRLDRLSLDDEIARDIIERMISWNPNDRPTIKIVLKHPLFWNKNRQLQFLQEVSDRAERLSPTDPVYQAIERDSTNVIGNDWTQYISRTLALDLRSHRTYQGSRIIDLIRAIRNKKHHFRELSQPLRQELGNGSPAQYISYFLERFPRLLPHVYNAMKCVAGEDNFRSYYCKSERHSSPYLRSMYPRPSRELRGDKLVGGSDSLNWRASSALANSRICRAPVPLENGSENNNDTISEMPPNVSSNAVDESPTAIDAIEDRLDTGVEMEMIGNPDPLRETSPDVDPTATATDNLNSHTEKVPQEESDEDPNETVDIGRSNKRNRCRVRKKKKKKWKGPSPTGQNDQPDAGNNLGREDDEIEDD